MKSSCIFHHRSQRTLVLGSSIRRYGFVIFAKIQEKCGEYTVLQHSLIFSRAALFLLSQRRSATWSRSRCRSTAAVSRARISPSFCFTTAWCRLYPQRHPQRRPQRRPQRHPQRHPQRLQTYAGGKSSRADRIDLLSDADFSLCIFCCRPMMIPPLLYSHFRVSQTQRALNSLHCLTVFPSVRWPHAPTTVPRRPRHFHHHGQVGQHWQFHAQLSVCQGAD